MFLSREGTALGDIRPPLSSSLFGTMGFLGLRDAHALPLAMPEPPNLEAEVTFFFFIAFSVRTPENIP